jgi:alpha-1,6-mannosyltransferase
MTQVQIRFGSITTAMLLLALLAASEVLYLLLLRLDAINGVRPVALFLAILGAAFAMCFAAYFVLRRGSAGFTVKALVVGGAILFRVTLLPAGLPPDLPFSEKLAAMAADWRGEAVTYERFQLFDDDIWRYLWDGHVGASGAKVYGAAPADASMDSLVGAPGQRPDWEAIRENINYSHLPTIYPPLAQLVFRAAHWLAPGSVLAMKAIVVGLDLLAYGFVILGLAARQQSPARSILYGWNPLVIKVFAGSGHVDALVVAALAGTCYFLVTKRRTAASVSLGLAVAAKVAPIVLIPFLARRVGVWRTALLIATVLACCVPYLGAGTHLLDSFVAFSTGWQFNGGPFRAIAWLIGAVAPNPELLARLVCGILAGIALLTLYRHDDADPNTFAGLATMALGCVLILSPVVMPWYVAWLLPVGVLACNRAAIFFSLAVCLAFLVMVRGAEWPWALVLEYGSLGGVIWWEAAHRHPPPFQRVAVS